MASKNEKLQFRKHSDTDLQEVVTKILQMLEPFHSNEILNIRTLAKSLIDNTETNTILHSANTKKMNPIIKLHDIKFTTKKKKETTIVKTVIDQGEEYVVANSSRKFNKKKLTDNKKEKFQRKSEDIHLYQDLGTINSAPPTKRTERPSSQEDFAVEDHPLLNAKQKRATRSSRTNSPNSRTSMAEISKNKLDQKSIKSDGKYTPLSQGTIESSQDSRITKISVKSIVSKKIPVVLINKLNIDPNQDTKELMDISDGKLSEELASKDKDDTELPRNKIAKNDTTFINLTENMDKEPISKNEEYVILIHRPEIVKFDTRDHYSLEDIEFETQKIAEAETQFMDPSIIIEEQKNYAPTNSRDSDKNRTNNENKTTNDLSLSINGIPSINEDIENPKTSLSKDEKQRKKGFLNNTVEMSPIKILSPPENNDATDGNENFLMLKRSLPFNDCSPARPILKRTLEIADEATVSPARKRKRVSFNDPPVSTTVFVQKYIRRCGFEKQQERELRAQRQRKLK